MTDDTTPDEPDDYTDPVEDQLERIIVDAEESLRMIREELAGHRQQRAQHDALEELPQLMNVTSERWTYVRHFFDELVEELRHSRPQQDESNRTGYTDGDPDGNADGDKADTA